MQTKRISNVYVFFSSFCFSIISQIATAWETISKSPFMFSIYVNAYANEIQPNAFEIFSLNTLYKTYAMMPDKWKISAFK